jgi:hypothetical protein
VNYKPDRNTTIETLREAAKRNSYGLDMHAVSEREALTQPSLADAAETIGLRFWHDLLAAFTRLAARRNLGPDTSCC